MAGLYNTEDFIFFLQGHYEDLGIGENDDEESEILGSFIESFNSLKDLLENSNNTSHNI